MFHPDEGDLVAAVDCEIEVLQQLNPFVGIIELLHAHDIIAQIPVRFEIDVGEFPRGNLDFLEGELVVDLFAARRLLALGRVRGEAQDELLQVLHLVLALLLLVARLALHELAHLVPEIVVSGIHADLAEIDIADMRAHLIEEVPVVRYDDDGVRRVDQKFFKPGDGLKVETVRRFVEQQDVRLSEDRLGEKHADLLAFVQLYHFSVVVGFLEPQSG